MINYEDALLKAKELKDDIDTCTEYDKGYLFSSETDKFSIGGDGPVVIMKENGNAINQTSFYDTYNPKEIKTTKI